MCFRRATTGCILILAFVASGCATSRPVGLIYSSYSEAESATSNQAGGRMGEACTSSYLFLVAVGDSSIETARRNGGITLITSVDQRIESFLGIYGKYCTVVRGR